jgi:flavin-dependent dehydrogenase
MPSALADPARVDVAIIGGGPAGAAAALTLRRHAPGLRVLVLEAGRYEAPKLGEVLPALARGLLEQLGVMPSFEAAGFVPGRAVDSAWTGDTLVERPSIFSAHGAGWQLDRARFDRLLAEAAAVAGADLRLAAPVRSAAETPTGWRLDLADGGTVDARMVIWATGRRWRLARAFGTTLQAGEPLAAFARFFTGTPGDSRIVIEARPEGWWYSADLPGARRVVACMTDPDIAATLGLREAEAWHAALAATRHIALLVAPGACAEQAIIRAAGTATLDRAIGRRWIAAGDTLFAADPLSSRGIVHALRSGILAAYAASDTLDGRGEEAARRYTLIASHGLADYRRALTDHYAAAARWPDAPFWQRRMAAIAA